MGLRRSDMRAATGFWPKLWDERFALGGSPISPTRDDLWSHKFPPFGLFFAELRSDERVVSGSRQSSGS
jgi:hypothetical protein